MSDPTHLKHVIAALARQIDEGVTLIVDDMDDFYAHQGANVIDLADMQHLAKLCEARHLTAEAARVRRWLSPA